MARLKSIFISCYVLITTIFTISSLDNWIQHDFNMAWSGVTIACGAVAIYFLRLFIFPTPRTGRYINSVIVLVLVGALLTIIDNLYHQHENIVALLYIIVIFTGWIAYEFWYSKLNQEYNTTLKFGNTLPLLNFFDHNGQAVLTTEFLGKPTVIMFYRGNWCPLCSAQIKELANQFDQFTERNANLVFVSPQPQKKTERLSKKHKIPAYFLIDQDNKVAKELKIVSQHGTPFGFKIFGYNSDTVLPTVIITNAQGKIVFLNLAENYRVRPEPTIFLNVLDELEASQ